jgi:hypothetical protein
MGSAKTSVLGEASDLLAGLHIIHAAIDLDALRLAIESGETRTVMYRNLQCVCENYAALRVTRLLMARAIEDRAELEFCRAIVSATNTVVCRLTASVEMMEQRVRMRESRMMQQDYLARVRALNAILDRARVEDFIVNSANRSVTEIAQEMLIKVDGFVSKTGG